MENLFEDYMAARCLIKAQKKKIEEFESGDRYLKLQRDYRRVSAGYIKEIKKLRAENGALNARLISTRNMWSDDYYALWEECQKQLAEKNKEIRKLEDRILETERKSDERIRRITLDYEDKLCEKDCIIEELTNQLAHAKALLDHDGTNTNTPTSQTPPGKKKRIPNTRTKTGRSKGGQPGHEKHDLQEPDDSEITSVEHHGGDSLEDFACPECGGDNYVAVGEPEIKYEYDVEIAVKRIKHIFHYYECLDCGTIFTAATPPNLRGKAQYGSGIQALALSLTNTVNAAMNKTSMFLAGLTLGELRPCEGYIAKLQRRGAKGLIQFRDDLKAKLITRQIVYWDDTVVMILTKRGCFRFYGDETIACYTAHEKKDKAGIEADGVLCLLTKDTFVMHDHNTVNYNKKYHFRNIECDQHLERDLQKNSDDTMHDWSTGMKSLIGKTIKERNQASIRGEKAFSEPYIAEFHKKLDEYLADGWVQNEKDRKKYGAKEEAALLRRIDEFRDNYFLWLHNFELPTTNNLSERALRGVKSHMKISGQFESVEAADNHALIKTYTETCRRNGINEMEALRRLCEGNPFTVREIFSKSPPQ